MQTYPGRAAQKGTWGKGKWSVEPWNDDESSGSMSEQQSSHAELIGKLKEIKELIIKLDGRVYNFQGAAAERNFTYKEQMNTMDGKIDALGEKLKALEEKLTATEEKINTLGTTLGATEEKINTLNKGCRATHEVVTALRSAGLKQEGEKQAEPLVVKPEEQDAVMASGS